MYIHVKESNIKGKKLTSLFYNETEQLVTTVHFGATVYPDYTISPHDEERRNRYITRHKAN
ncbi:MAG: hypothetical protein ACKPKO_28270 [Candidatus Fonsibacter sp.]